MSAQVYSAVVVDLRACTRHQHCNCDDREVELHVTGTVEDDGDGGWMPEVLGVAEADGGGRIVPDRELLEDCENALANAAEVAANNLPYVLP
jgi:hypothetical protein